MNVETLYSLFDVEKIDALLGEKYWSPIDIAKVNDLVLRAAAFKGEFHMHFHEHDELFYVYKGNITIDTENGPIYLKEGQGAVVPAKIKHKPKSEGRSIVLMLDLYESNYKGD